MSKHFLIRSLLCGGWEVQHALFDRFFFLVPLGALGGVLFLKGCSGTSTSCSRSSASCSGKNRQGSTSVTSLKNCNIPNVTTNTTYLAVLPPVLNIFPVSCTLEAQQMEIAIGEKCFKLKPGTVSNFQMHLILGIHNACAIPRH